MGLVFQVLHVLLGGRMGTQIADFCVNAALAEAAVRPVGVVGVAAQPGPELLHLQPHVAKFLLVDFHIAPQLNDSKRNEKQLKRSNPHSTKVKIFSTSVKIAFFQILLKI